MAEALIRGIQITFRSLRTRERPFVLTAQHEFFNGMANIELYGWLIFPAALVTFEKVIEKALLQRNAITI
jgi:hypothetical protein